MRKKKIIKTITTILFIGLIILIYLVSPKITEIIQNCAKYIAEVDSNYITRIVELILAISLIGTTVLTKKK